MTLSLGYILGALCTLAWILYGLVAAWRGGGIAITGDNDDAKTEMFWFYAAQGAHSAVGAAAIWPVTLLFQLWSLRKAASNGPPKITLGGGISSHYPAKEQVERQRQAVFSATTATLYQLPEWTNTFVLADVLLEIAAFQLWEECRHLDLSERTYRDHLLSRVSAMCDAVVAAGKDREPLPKMKAPPVEPSP